MLNLTRLMPDPGILGEGVMDKFRIIILSLALLLFIPNCWADIALDATSNESGNFSSSFSWSHTCTGSDLILVVSVGQAGDFAQHPLRTISSITYNSVALTEIDTQNETRYNLLQTSLWYLTNPAIGSNTVEVTFNDVAYLVHGGAVSLTGVDQTTPLDAFNKAENDTGSPTVDVTTVADNAWLVDIFSDAQSTTTKITVGTNQTERWKIDKGTDTIGVSTEGPVSPAGSTTMNWVDSDNDEEWAIVAASFKPSAAAASAPPVQIRRGVTLRRNVTIRAE